jgi:hypothetical protein
MGMGGTTREGEGAGRRGAKREGIEGKEREDMGGEGKDYGQGRLRHDSWGKDASANSDEGDLFTFKANFAPMLCYFKSRAKL